MHQDKADRNPSPNIHIASGHWLFYERKMLYTFSVQATSHDDLLPSSIPNVEANKRNCHHNHYHNHHRAM